MNAILCRGGLEAAAVGAKKAPAACPLGRSSSPCVSGRDGLFLGPSGTLMATPPPPPCGTHVKVIGARDADRSGRAEHDLYITCGIISSGATVKKFETKLVCNSRLDPTWNEEFNLLNYIPASTDLLVFKLLGKTKHSIGSDYCLGSATLNGSQLYPAGFDGELDLAGEKAVGKLRLKVVLCDGIAQTFPLGSGDAGADPIGELSNMACSKLEGRDGSLGGSPATPMSGRFRTQGPSTPVLRASQAGPKNTSLAVKTQESNNSSLISIVHREVEQLETRLSLQITRLRDGVSAATQKTDTLREVSQARLDAKVAASESSITKFDRKMSEFAGTLRGLSEEAEAQIRRADSMDTRLWEFRHKLEEEFRQKFADMSTNFEEVVSSYRVTLAAGDDAHKRLAQQVKRLDNTLQELVSRDRDTGQAIVNLQTRVEAVEDSCQREMESAKAACKELVGTTALPSEAASCQTDTRFWQLETQGLDIAQKVDRLFLEIHGDRGYEARFQQHEVRLTGMRIKLDSQDEHYASFDERFRQDWESRFDNLRKAIQESTDKHLDSFERLEALQRRTEATEYAFEALRDMCANAQAEVASLTPQKDLQKPRIDALGSNMRSLADQVQVLDVSIGSIYEKLRELDLTNSAKAKQECSNHLDMQRRMVKVEHEMNLVNDSIQAQAKLMTTMTKQSPREPSPTPVSQQIVHRLDERTKALEDKFMSVSKVSTLTPRVTATEVAVTCLRSQFDEVWNHLLARPMLHEAIGFEARRALSLGAGSSNSSPDETILPTGLCLQGAGSSKKSPDASAMQGVDGEFSSS